MDQKFENSKMKVLFFLPPSVGGAERMTVLIAKMLPQEEFEVKFIVVGKTLGDIVKFIPEGYSVRLLRINKIWHWGAIRLWKVVQEEKPDIGFSSLLYLNARLILVSKICRTKVIVRNNIDLSRTPSKINKLLVRLTYKWADKVIAQQEEMHDEIISYTGLPADKVITLHNPIDVEYIQECIKATNPFPKEAQNQYKYIWTARFSSQKGQDLLVQAFNILLRKKPNAHLYLLGKYDEESAFYTSIIDYIQSHKMQEFVHFLGVDSNPYRWIKYADCFVMPSRFEGLPNALIDAMYLGKPVVATRCIPVIDRIVKDGYNGILVPPEDVDAMADAMVKALQLRDFKMTYRGASKEDFINLFK